MTSINTNTGPGSDWAIQQAQQQSTATNTAAAGRVPISDTVTQAQPTSGTQVETYLNPANKVTLPPATVNQVRPEEFDQALSSLMGSLDSNFDGLKQLGTTLQPTSTYYSNVG